MMKNRKVYFRVIDHSQGGHVGGAELNYWADCESAQDAIKFYCDSQNKQIEERRVGKECRL